jgi:hypothetical protein
MGISTWTPPDILISGTQEPDLLIDRIRRFSALVQARFEEVQMLIERVGERP